MPKVRQAILGNIYSDAGIDLSQITPTGTSIVFSSGRRAVLQASSSKKFAASWTKASGAAVSPAQEHGPSSLRCSRNASPHYARLER